jgi:predicted nuclease of restriction endonuclease-like (RecB) superfamily
MKNKLIPSGYNNFLKENKQRILNKQYEALKSVSKELIFLYWDISGKIVDNQKKYGWWKAIVEMFAKDFQKEIPEIAGYSADNLWRMRKFYLNYANKPKLAPLVQEIAWAHNIIILEKCKNDLSCEFYVHMAIKYGWIKMCLYIRLKIKVMKKRYLIKLILIKHYLKKSRNRLL